jgi:hypothetical protein
MSAFPVTDVFHRGPPGLDVPFLGKPFSPEALLATVKERLLPSEPSARELLDRHEPDTA